MDETYKWQGVGTYRAFCTAGNLTQKVFFYVKSCKNIPPTANVICCRLKDRRATVSLFPWRHHHHHPDHFPYNHHLDRHLQLQQLSIRFQERLPSLCRRFNCHQIAHNVAQQCLKIHSFKTNQNLYTDTGLCVDISALTMLLTLLTWVKYIILSTQGYWKGFLSGSQRGKTSPQTPPAV